VLGALIAFFCFWGAWEMAARLPSAPQAIVPALVFAGFGCVALLSGAATFLFGGAAQPGATAPGLHPSSRAREQ
jgi:hypothetical protein